MNDEIIKKGEILTPTQFDKTSPIPSPPYRMLRDGGDASRSVPRVDPVVLRGSTPSSPEEGSDRTEPDKNVHYFQNEWEFTWA